MSAKVVTIFIVCFLNIGVNRTKGLHLKAEIINGDDVGYPVVGDDGQTIFRPDGEYPYMASMEVSGWPNCGAVIVHKSVVLTAAHCANHFNVSDMAVRAGTMYSRDRIESSQVSKVSHLWYHPYFDGIHYEHDIGMLFLETPFTYTMYVNKIRIVYNEDYTGETLTALGFGITSDSGTNDINLKKADLTVISTLACRKRSKKYFIPRDMICAIGNQNQGTCFGDSGGPFVKHYPGRPEQDYVVGIASWVPGFCDPKGFFMFSTVYSSADFLKAEFYKNKIVL